MLTVSHKIANNCWLFSSGRSQAKQKLASLEANQKLCSGDQSNYRQGANDILSLYYPKSKDNRVSWALTTWLQY